MRRDTHRMFPNRQEQTEERSKQTDTEGCTMRAGHRALFVGLFSSANSSTMDPLFNSRSIHFLPPLLLCSFVTVTLHTYWLILLVVLADRWMVFVGFKLVSISAEVMVCTQPSFNFPIVYSNLLLWWKFDHVEECQIEAFYEGAFDISLLFCNLNLPNNIQKGLPVSIFRFAYEMKWQINL